MKIKALTLVLALTVFAACDKKESAPGASPAPVTPSNNNNGNLGNNNTGNPSNPGSSRVITGLKYYKGGFFPGPGQPTWSHDMNMVWDQTVGFRISALHNDPTCTRSTVTMTS